MDTNEQEIFLIKQRLREKIATKPIKIHETLTRQHNISNPPEDDGLTIPDYRSFLID